VSDDGKGIDGEAMSKIALGESVGVGLRGMQERVRQLGGSVEIRSNGNGTTVTATMPLHSAGAPASNSNGEIQDRNRMKLRLGPSKPA
jgi:signal transduction histidine kinase